MQLAKRLDLWHLFTSIKTLINFKVGIFISLIILTTLAFDQTSSPETLISVGDRWSKETLVAELDFPIYKSDDSLRAETQRIHNSIEPIFYDFPDAWQRSRQIVDSLSVSLERTFAAYTDYLVGARRDTVAAGNEIDLISLSQSTIDDSLLFIDLRLQTSIRMSDLDWRKLGWDYALRTPEIRTNVPIETSSSPLFERILNGIASRSQRLQLQKVLNIPRDSIHSSNVIIRDTVEQTFSRLPSSNVLTQFEARERIQVWLEETILQQDSVLTSNAISQLIAAVFTPSAIYQADPTEQRRKEAEFQIIPVRGMVAEGEEIVRNGEIITQEIKQKIDSLERELGSEMPATRERLQLIGKILLSLTIIAILSIFLRYARPNIFQDTKSIILISVLYAGTIIAFGIVIRLAPPEFMYTVPVVIVSVLLTVIFDSRLALLTTCAIALVGGFLLHSDYTYTWSTLVAGTVAILSARDLRNRGQLFLTAAYAFGGYGLALGTLWLYEGGVWPQLQEDLLLAGVGSFLLITAYPFLWVLERVFDITTDLRLLELSDTNHPLLRELMKKAPGTCNHSMQVSSLAGSVADEIGANTLLTRVGALYHDVGKLYSPEYFIENQMGGNNPHDELLPSKSAQVIISHVSKGLELGEKYRLPAKVIHLIASHHGTTRTEYFYQKALEDSKSNSKDLDEKPFTYPGPQPNSKEAGILMLTDTVEAASRTMQDITSEKLQDLIDQLIDHKIEDRQLDNTGLTFRDIFLIKKILLEQLLAFHHVRISYQSDRDSKPNQIA
ncbi:MAG: HDIG domain-containing protein [Bacteroidetes bacterium]|nr:HDIG domain-containing protein [Bacteroidota bacterium]MCY4233133.1 HDIG domain-containing protein [Bacteroidota bacterium]